MTDITDTIRTIAADCGREWADQASYDEPSDDDLFLMQGDYDAMAEAGLDLDDTDAVREAEGIARKAYATRIAERRAAGEVR